MATPIDIDTAIEQFVTMEGGQEPRNYNYVQPFACCDAYDYAIDGDVNNVVTMVKNHWPLDKTDNRPWYSTTNTMGDKYYLYFKFDDDAEASRIPKSSRPGRWYLASGKQSTDPANVLGNPQAVKYVTQKASDFFVYRNGVDLCPNDPISDLWMGENLQQAANDFNLFQCKPKSGQTWVPVTTCDDPSSAWMFHGPWGSKNLDVCKLDDVVNELVKKQMDQLIFYRPDSDAIVRPYLEGIRKAIQDLKQNECMSTVDGTHGQFVKGCQRVCDAIEDLPFPVYIHGVFDAIYRTYQASITTWEKDYKKCAEITNNLKKSFNGFKQFTGVNF